MVFPCLPVTDERRGEPGAAEWALPVTRAVVHDGAGGDSREDQAFRLALVDEGTRLRDSAGFAPASPGHED